MNLKNRCFCAILAVMTAVIFGGSAAAQSFELEPRVGFPDFRFMEKAGRYTGPVFVLSDNYPKKNPPALDPAVQKILKIDFIGDPMAYVMAVRDYVFAGNIHGGPVAEDFILQNNTTHKWYHVPWQHWGPLGREGFHGLTREGPLSAKVLAPTQNEASSAYAIGFYNGPGGFAIGQVWPSADEGPNLERMIAGKGFPEGTVVGKFLFTVLDSTQVPWLKNPLQWNAYIYDCDLPVAGDCPKGPTGNEAHSTQKVNLLQMDVMVKDSRATDAAGWVFGTFAYNGNLPKDSPYSAFCAKVTGPGKNWCNLVPVGVMWGNDPEIKQTYINDTPTETVINLNLKATWINPDKKNLPAMHLGFNSRLNGPADNPSSSCMSCHSTGQFPDVSAIMPWLNEPKVPIPPNGTIAGPDWMRWFRNFTDGEAFDKGLAIPMDFSMQLSKSVENYIQYRSQEQGGQYALEYWGKGSVYTVGRGALRSK